MRTEGQLNQSRGTAAAEEWSQSTGTAASEALAQWIDLLADIIAAEVQAEEQNGAPE
ncbi:MAG TPA: hypothetical protein VEH53_03535 [archaeon]|nr:hypothetical protein [archaeon]